jgi:hypothetical protein
MVSRSLLAAVVVALAAALALARCGQGACRSCTPDPFPSSNVCQLACVGEDGGCVPNGQPANEGTTCQQTNSTHGTCVGGTCNVTRCEGCVPCQVSACVTGLKCCIGGGPLGPCQGNTPIDAGTPCDGGTCNGAGVCVP